MSTNLARRSICAVALSVAAASCQAPDGVSIHEENDFFGLGNRSDDNYTQGLRVHAWYRPSNFSPGARELIHKASKWNPFFGGHDGRLTERSTNWLSMYGWTIGQSFYTPQDLTLDPPESTDRPYAGWLQSSVEGLWLEPVKDDVSQEFAQTGDKQEIARITFGLVGPAAGAEQVQSEWHRLINDTHPEGWSHQLGAEPTIMYSWAKKHTVLATDESSSGFAADMSATCGASLGTPFTVASGSVGLRVGYRPPRFGWIDVGPGDHAGGVIPQIRPRVSGSGASESDAPTRLRFYGTLDARATAVGWNTFLDGNLDGDGPSVDAKRLVGELQFGLVLARGRYSLAWVLQDRSPEFAEDSDSHRIGAILLSYTFEL